MKKIVNQQDSLLSGLINRVRNLMVRVTRKQKIILGVCVFFVYLAGVIIAALEGNYTFREAANVGEVSFEAMKCYQSESVSRSKLNSDSASPFLWRAYPIMTATTAILKDTNCFGALVSGMRNYPGKYVLYVYDEASGETVLNIVKK